MVKSSSSKLSSVMSSMPKMSNDWLFYIMIFLGLVIFSALAYVLFYGKCFESFTDGDGPVLYYFYMEKCPHCNDFNPSWEEVSKKMKETDMKVSLKKVNLQDEANKELVDKFGVSGAPTIMFVNGEKSSEFNDERTSDAVLQFVKSQME